MLRIENLSIRSVTTIIFLMIAMVAVILSIFAGNYFRQAALDAQMSSLSRVIEVAAQEVIKEVREVTFDLGMHLGHSRELMQAMAAINQPGEHERLVRLLDDPFINGFVGVSSISLEKIRVYDLDLNLLGQSGMGHSGIKPELAPYIVKMLVQRTGVDRLKAVDALWLSSLGPMYSTLVPIGGLRLTGYLEVVINPVFNLPDIGRITNTLISIFSMTGEPIIEAEQTPGDSHLPVEYIMYASNKEPAFRIVGYEDVRQLNQEMEQTQFITISGFLLLSIVTLIFALWLFNRFLFVPVRRMTRDMQKMADGKLDLTVDKKGLRDFSIMAEAFDAMANQVRLRTNDLERLLDLDDIAILCFGNNGEAAYFNKRASSLFGYASDEISDLDLHDLFPDEVVELLRDSYQPDNSSQHKVYMHLTGMTKDGSLIESDAVIRPLQGQGGEGYAIVLNTALKHDDKTLSGDVVSSVQKSEQRMNAVEQSLNSLLELARSNPGLVSGDSPREFMRTRKGDLEPDKDVLRQQAVNVMCAALVCWEHNLGKSKLDLAEESRIWPVYIDKSTPTTRTLDKYLNLESCPKNPRTQRVIDSAEFVLKQLGKKTTAERDKLQQTLDAFRSLISGMRSAGK